MKNLFWYLNLFFKWNPSTKKKQNRKKKRAAYLQEQYFHFFSPWWCSHQHKYSENWDLLVCLIPLSIPEENSNTFYLENIKYDKKFTLWTRNRNNNVNIVFYGYSFLHQSGVVLILFPSSSSNQLKKLMTSYMKLKISSRNFPSPALRTSRFFECWCHYIKIVATCWGIIGIMVLLKVKKGTLILFCCCWKNPCAMTPLCHQPRF